MLKLRQHAIFGQVFMLKLGFSRIKGNAGLFSKAYVFQGDKITRVF